MSGFKQVENLEDGSELEADVSIQMKRSTLKKTAVALATAMVVCVGIFALSTNGFSRSCSNVGALQGKSSLDLSSAIRSTSEKLIQATKNNQTLADETVLKAMVKAGRKVQDHWEKHHIRKLDTLMTIRRVKGFRQRQKAKLAGMAECSFNILEAFVSVVGMGDDINAIIRTCPAPRDGESELACQVNGAILGAWVGNLAAKLALAASDCALSLNVDAICSAGVAGLVSAMGEIAAGASLGVACSGTPPQLSTTKVSVLGDQTVRDSRRLLIGEGAVGNGVQCGVDVGMVAANIANMGLAINKAVNVNKCKASTFRSPLNVFKGIPETLCTIDIGGAVAYIGEVVTFINLIVVHCKDFLDVNALCAGSIAAITTGAAAIVPYGAAVHAACANNHFLKTPKSQAQLSKLWYSPGYDPVSGLRRRLTEEETAAKQPLKESLSQIAANRETLEELKKATDVPKPGSTEADMETLLNLMGGEDKARVAWQC
ncbi:unnamed protein product [Cladocopium goreaui]|uniref:Uncharacterized protein n=1 Tax=Cladocopium goreaui TaxID=2562237 RepID=A0A9P1CZY8_9DINO|nr:unnamed protein product [Cladocopium goreaui]